MSYSQEVYSWFRELHGAKRVEFLYGILQLCLPLELRFIGTCLEDIARRDYSYLRDAETRSNDTESLRAVGSDLSCNVTRSKFIVTLAMLRVDNSECAKIVSDVLTQDSNSFLKNIVVDSSVVDQFLLLYTLACTHPAFSFGMRTALGRQLVEMREYFVKNNYLPSEASIFDGLCQPSHRGEDGIIPCSCDPSYSVFLAINIILITDAKNTRSSDVGDVIIDIDTHWKRGPITQIKRAVSDFLLLHDSLKSSFQSEITVLSNIVDSVRTTSSIQKSFIISCINSYFEALLKMPNEISRSSTLFSFLLDINSDLVKAESCFYFTSHDSLTYFFPKSACSFQSPLRTSEVKRVPRGTPGKKQDEDSSTYDYDVTLRNILSKATSPLISSAGTLLLCRERLKQYPLDQLFEISQKNLEDNGTSTDLSRSLITAIDSLKTYICANNVFVNHQGGLMHRPLSAKPCATPTENEHGIHNPHVVPNSVNNGCHREHLGHSNSTMDVNRNRIAFTNPNLRSSMTPANTVPLNSFDSFRIPNFRPNFGLVMNSLIPFDGSFISAHYPQFSRDGFLRFPADMSNGPDVFWQHMPNSQFVTIENPNSRTPCLDRITAASMKKNLSCYNCGSSTHIGSSCTESSLDASSRSFRLDFRGHPNNLQ